MLLMTLIKLHPEILIDTEDLERLRHDVADIDNNGYIMLKHKGKRVALHRVIMDFPLLRVDHKNQNKLDCRKKNLRLATGSQNSANAVAPINNTSGYKGVTWDKQPKRWRAQIGYKGEPMYLGLFKTKEEAARAYNKAAKRIFGEFACLNQVEEEANEPGLEETTRARLKKTFRK